jgi:hypothetical protein
MDSRGSFNNNLRSGLNSSNNFNRSTISNNSINNFQTTTNDYGQTWLVNDAKTLQELGDNDIKLRYLEKSLKSQRRLQQREIAKHEQMMHIQNQQEDQDLEIPQNTHESRDVNEKYKFDKNAVVGRKFPFKADEFKYPNDGKEKPKSLYIKYNDEYGSKKPNDLELPGKKLYY